MVWRSIIAVTLGRLPGYGKLPEMRKNNVPRSLHCEGRVILNTCKAGGREGFAVARVDDKMRKAKNGSRRF